MPSSSTEGWTGMLSGPSTRKNSHIYTTWPRIICSYLCTVWVGGWDKGNLCDSEREKIIRMKRKECGQQAYIRANDHGPEPTHQIVQLPWSVIAMVDHNDHLPCNPTGRIRGPLTHSPTVLNPPLPLILTPSPIPSPTPESQSQRSKACSRALRASPCRHVTTMSQSGSQHPNGRNSLLRRGNKKKKERKTERRRIQSVIVITCLWDSSTGKRKREREREREGEGEGEKGGGFGDWAKGNEVAKGKEGRKERKGQRSFGCGQHTHTYTHTHSLSLFIYLSLYKWTCEQERTKRKRAKRIEQNRTEQNRIEQNSQKKKKKKKKNPFKAPIQTFPWTDSPPPPTPPQPPSSSRSTFLSLLSTIYRAIITAKKSSRLSTIAARRDTRPPPPPPPRCDPIPSLLYIRSPIWVISLASGPARSHIQRVRRGGGGFFQKKKHTHTQQYKYKVIRPRWDEYEGSEWVSISIE